MHAFPGELLVQELALLRPILLALDLAVTHRAEGSGSTRLVYAPGAASCSIPVNGVRVMTADAPLFRPCGTPLGSLEFLGAQPLPNEAALVLEPLLRLAAMSISERWACSVCGKESAVPIGGKTMGK